MFKGFVPSMLIVVGFLVVLPALILLGLGGEAWLEQLKKMTPTH